MARREESRREEGNHQAANNVAGKARRPFWKTAAWRVAAGGKERQEKLAGEAGLRLASKGAKRKAGESDQALFKRFVHKPQFY